MSIPKNWSEFADDLELLLDNRLDPKKFRTKYERKWEAKSDNIYDTLANVYHFLSDFDIHEKDPQYKKMQENEMKKLISLIRKGSSIKDMLKISFLGESDVKV